MHMTFFCIEHVELGERWTFKHRMGDSYVENKQLPEAAVAYEEEHVRKLVQDCGFADVTVLPKKLQSVLLARKPYHSESVQA